MNVSLLVNLITSTTTANNKCINTTIKKYRNMVKIKYINRLSLCLIGANVLDFKQVNNINQ